MYIIVDAVFRIDSFQDESVLAALIVWDERFHHPIEQM